MIVQWLHSMITAVLLLIFGCSVMAAAYTCPSTCVPPNCKCATSSAPLPVEQMPQFVVFTHDDATNDYSAKIINKTVTGFKNPNGCNIPVTYFTMKAQTDCEIIKAQYQAGHEIATHTVSHLAMPPGFTGGVGSIDGEINGARDYLITTCGLPKEDVVGFRSPYLVHNPSYRQVLSKAGFLYDSSINEHWPMPTSPTGKERVWPYSMDYGIPQDCSWISGVVCEATEKYAGLWEIPVWVLQTDNYPNPAYAMDPCTGENGPCNSNDLLKYMFTTSYNGNKAPVPVYIHSPWLENNTADIRSFIQYVTSTYPDAYFVTMRQLIQWLQNPVPKDQMNSWLGCETGGKAAGTVTAPVPLPAPVSAAPVPAEAVPAPIPATQVEQVAADVANAVSPPAEGSAMGTSITPILLGVMGTVLLQQV